MLLTLCVANLPIVVRVFGVPTTSGCDGGTKGGTWRDATEWVARSLKTRFGDQVRVEYFDLFLDAIDAFPQVMGLVARGEAKPPLVFVGGDWKPWDWRRMRITEFDTPCQRLNAETHLSPIVLRSQKLNYIVTQF